MCFYFETITFDFSNPQSELHQHKIKACNILHISNFENYLLLLLIHSGYPYLIKCSFFFYQTHLTQHDGTQPDRTQLDCIQPDVMSASRFPLELNILTLPVIAEQFLRKLGMENDVETNRWLKLSTVSPEIPQSPALIRYSLFPHIC